MQKINFQNLPNTTTPVNATDLNQLQTNVESEINSRDYRQSFTIPANSSKTLSFTQSPFTILFSGRAQVGAGHTSYILTGYGAGTSDRYSCIKLEGNSNNHISFSISGQTITVTNSASNQYSCSLFFLIGSISNVSIS